MFMEKSKTLSLVSRNKSKKIKSTFHEPSRRFELCRFTQFKVHEGSLYLTLWLVDFIQDDTICINEKLPFDQIYVYLWSILLIFDYYELFTLIFRILSLVSTSQTAENRRDFAYKYLYLNTRCVNQAIARTLRVAEVKSIN